jgi:mono/diheme cytochrome c family protein
LLVAGLAAGCRQSQPQAQAPIDLASVDSVLAELGGTLTASLERGQRWRMISSIGVGLPPNDFRPEDLPEPGSRGAGLLQVYCIQCHWLPTPQMHSASEWPILVKRNILRMQQLKDRLGGPLTSGLVGEVVMAGYESAELPAAADVDTLLAYLKKYALPTARPEELTEGPGRALFLEKCSVCHEAPSPRAHTASGWERAVAQMQANMAVSDVKPLGPAEVDSITAYLRPRASR